jgi:uncharacterized protein
LTYLSHILVIISLLILPIASVLDIKKLRLSKDPKAKERTYLKIFMWFWLSLMGYIISSPINDVFFVTRPIAFNNIGNIAFYLILSYYLITQVFPILLIFFSEKFRGLVSKAYKNNSFIFPTTPRQKKLFWIVPITVGICEEIIFRGYLYQYFTSSPYGFSALASFLLCTVIFGLGHFQQGVSGVIDSTLLGFMLGFIYFATGNLYISILIHILFDFKLLFIPYLLSKRKTVVDHISTP